MYDLKNFTKVSNKLRKQTTISKTFFYGRFSVISLLATPVGLRVLNYSHKHVTEFRVRVDFKINVYIPLGCFIIFNCGLDRAGT